MEAGVYAWEAWTMALPSGRRVTPALAIRPSSVGPHDAATSAEATRLIVDVVPEGADATALEGLLSEYVAIPALADVVRVGHRRRAVVVHSRADGWQRRAYARGLAPLPGLGTSLSVSAVYR